MRAAAGVAIGVALAAGLLAGCELGNGDDRGQDAPREFYGVVTAEPLPDESRLARLGDAELGTLRISLPWGSVQSAPGAAYEWSRYDDLIRGAAENSIQVFATVYSSPVWALPTPEHPPLGAHLAGFEEFVRAAVRRYGPGGAFWAENPDLPELPIADWQLWNEPNRADFWPPEVNAEEYLTLLRVFHDAVKGAAPDARIVLAGLFFLPGPRDGVPLETFLPDLYEGGGGSLFDAVAVHPYAGTPERALRRVERTREVMRRFGDGDKPLWVTEIGWGSGGAPSQLTVTLERQAEYVTEAYELLAADRERLGIAGVIWFSLEDIPGSHLWVSYAGLFMAEGEPKPSWDAFVELTDGAP